MVGIENLKFKRKILIMSCYPPPNDARFVTHFINALNLVYFNNYHSVVFMGDFNFPNIHWIDGSGFSHCTTNDENRLVDILKDMYLFQVIQSPTPVLTNIQTVSLLSQVVLLLLKLEFHLISTP